MLIVGYNKHTTLEVIESNDEGINSIDIQVICRLFFGQNKFKSETWKSINFIIYLIENQYVRIIVDS